MLLSFVPFQLPSHPMRVFDHFVADGIEVHARRTGWVGQKTSGACECKAHVMRYLPAVKAEARFFCVGGEGPSKVLEALQREYPGKDRLARPEGEEGVVKCLFQELIEGGKVVQDHLFHLVPDLRADVRIEAHLPICV